MSKRRVVITGMGCVTSLGLTVDTVWNNIITGVSGVGMISRFDTSEHTVKIGGQIADWNSPNIEPREAKRLDRFSQFALNAAMDATKDAGMDFSTINPWRCGAIIGTGIGGIEEFEEGYRKMIEKGPSRVSPFMVPKLMCNAGSGNVAIHFGLKGPNAAVATACASGGHAIGAAVDAIRNNAADVMITGGSEAALTPLGLACFIALKALSKRNDDPTRASRPFDKDRDGFILAEGAGILVLEEYEYAKARGAKIYGELMGYGSTCDGSHITAPLEDGAGAAFAMEMALKDAGLNSDQIGYINAHGTSTGLGDIAETRAVKKLFGQRAYQIPVSSTKSMTGHLLGASGGAEAIFTTMAIRSGILPPTINLENPDEECDLDYIPNVAREKQIQYGMSNSFGFGGHNVSLVIGKI